MPSHVHPSLQPESPGSAKPSQNPVRVLLWAPSGSGEHYHGPGSFAYRLYSAAEPGRFNVTLAHGFPQQQRHSLFNQQHLISPLDGGAFSLWKFLRRSTQWLCAHANRFDVFHGLSGFHATVGPAGLAQRLGIPSVVFLSTGNEELSDKSGFRALLGLPRKRRKILNTISGTIAMSGSVHQELLKQGIPARKIARIPMGVNTDDFHPSDESQRRALRAQLGWRDVPTVVFVGGINSNKRPHLLIEALATEKADDFPWQVALIGPEHDQQYCDQLRARAAQLGVESRVIWHGFTNHPAPLYRASDVFCLLSINEGMPAALVEAMASGLPSIITTVPGMMELVNDGVHGRVIDPDPHQISNSIRKYLTQPQIAFQQGSAARAKIIDGFSTRRVLELYERLFRRIMSGGDAAESDSLNDTLTNDDGGSR